MSPEGKNVQPIDEDQVAGKNVFHSKTFWLNIVLIVAIIWNTYTPWGFEISPVFQGAVMALINMFLRFITKKPIVWKKQ